MRFIIVIIIILSSNALFAQKSGRGYFEQRVEYNQQGDSIITIDLWPIYIFDKPVDMRRHAKLIRNVKVAYPIAIVAGRKLKELEKELVLIEGKRGQSKHIKQLEKDLKEEYMPILKKMNFSQGKILIKLIDRETNQSSYSLIKEFRGGFSAFCWQGIATVFGADLKDNYDKKEEDKVIEQIILMYEAGLL